MFNFVRKIVAGPKKITNQQGQQLDLTYITNRIIAMAYPASDFIQKTYRNPIQQVAAYLHKHHNTNYYVFNVSNRPYDHSQFEGRVKDYEWPDHQAPALTTLVQIGFDIYAYLHGNQQRVIAVHCNHGKGRTGTAIISFMVLVGYFKSSIQCLKYYNQKRFNNNTYGVDQPCQLRYLRFLQQLLAHPKINQKLSCYRLSKVSQKGLSNSCFLNIYSTRTQKSILQKVQFGQKLDQKHKNSILIGDIFIQVMDQTWKGNIRIARINYNLYFTQQSMQLIFNSANIKLENAHYLDFSISLSLQYFCLCHLPTYSETVCACKATRNIEEAYWINMIDQIKKCKKIPPKDSLTLVQRDSDKNDIKQENESETIIHFKLKNNDGQQQSKPNQGGLGKNKQEVKQVSQIKQKETINRPQQLQAKSTQQYFKNGNPNRQLKSRKGTDKKLEDAMDHNNTELV